MKIAIVTSDITGPIQGGGVGTACFLMAQALARENHQVRIFFANEQAQRSSALGYWQCYYKMRNIQLEPIPPADFPIEDHGHEHASQAMKVYLHLRSLQFDTLIFPEMHGLGHFCALAKKTGLEFRSTRLWVMFHGPTAWHQSFNWGMPASFSELSLAHMEKSSCLNADKVFFATAHAKSVALEMGYLNNQQPSQVLMFTFEKGKFRKRSRQTVKEICFFGRIETRKGIETFLSAASEILPLLQKNRIRLILLGNFGTVQGRPAETFLKEWMQEHKFFVEVLYLDRPSAIRYLADNEPLVVMPSLAETMGYTLIECLQNGIPFICSDIPAFRDVLRSFSANDNSLFKAGDARDLARKIRSVILKGANSRKMNKNFYGTIRQKWNLQFKNSDKRTDVTLRKRQVAKFSLLITHQDRIELLENLLERIMSLRERPHEILIYVGATDAKSVAKIKALQKEIQGISVRVVLGPKSAGYGEMRNRMAKLAVGDYLFFMDSAHLPTNPLFGDLAIIIESAPSDVILSSAIKFHMELSNENGKRLIAGSHFTLAVGEDLTMNIMQNLFGSNSCCIRREFFISSGEFSTTLEKSVEHEFFLRASAKNANFRFCPKPLVLERLSSKPSVDKVNLHRDRSQFLERVNQSIFGGKIGNFLLLSESATLAKTSPKIWASNQVRPAHPPRLIRDLPTPKIKTLKAVQARLTNKTYLSEFSLVVITADTFAKVRRRSFPALTLYLKILAPKAVDVSVSTMGPKISLGAGNNWIQLTFNSEHPLTLVSSLSGLELYILDVSFQAENVE